MKFALWTLFWFALIVAAAAFGTWLVGKPVPLEDSPAVKEARAHMYEMERLRALSLAPQPPRDRCRRGVYFSSETITNAQDCL